MDSDSHDEDSICDKEGDGSLVCNLPFSDCESFNDLFDFKIEGFVFAAQSFHGLRNTTNAENRGRLAFDVHAKRAEAFASMQLHIDCVLVYLYPTFVFYQIKFIGRNNDDEEKIVRCIEVPKPMRSCLTSRKIKSKIKTIAKESRSGIEVILPKKKFLRIVALKEEQINYSEMRLSTLLLQIKHKLPFTHFISIPFTDEKMQKSFSEFRSQVLQDPSTLYSNVDALLFQNPNKIHLTFGILVLMTDEERTKASRLLQQCQEEIVKPLLANHSLVVDVKGVDVMNRDASKAHVLYGKIQNAGLLQAVADQIVERFAKSDLMGRQKDGVKLHVTLMNSLFRQRKGKRRRSGDNTYPQSTEVKERKKRECFDAREILRRLGEYSFVEKLVLTEIHLSKVSFVDKDGYYSPMEKITL